MNVLTIITIIITGVCLSWSLGLYVFYRVKKSKVQKKAKEELNDDKEGIEASSKN